MSNPFVTIDDFLSMPVFFWHTVGVDPYKTVTDKIKSWKLCVSFVIQILNLNFILAMEFAFLYLSFKNSENFVQACMVMAFVGFVCVGELKIVKVWWERNHLDALVREMESIFPSPEAEAQDKYKVDLYRKRCRWIMKFLISIFLILITTYNLFDIVQFITHRYVLKVSDARTAMPYTPISPWGLDTKMGFTTMYASQALAGYTCTAGQLSSAILIYGIVMQDIMHFDYLSRTLKGLKLSFTTYAEDLKVLQQLIIYHNKLMRISDVINEVFGVTLLLNFLASSILVCMLGFQISIGLSPELVYKMFIYLVAATMETYLLCYFSDSLIVASQGVSWTVYEMNWLETDRRFAKMLILIAVRAQKPVFLKATVFLDISMETMTKFLQVSYRFFCVIRTMYG